MAQMTIHGRTYDADDLRLSPGISVRGEHCLMLEAAPLDGLDPHFLATIPYPSPEFAACAATTAAAHRALMACATILDLARDVDDDETRERITAAAEQPIDLLRAALRAAGRI